MTTPPLSLQMGTLYESNDASSFTGSGGPYGFSPWTSQFGGVISSAGLLAEPFSDAVWNVAAGDELIFVLAVQNLLAAPIYNLALQSPLPTGFAAPPEGENLTVTDGAGNDLAFTGNLTTGLHVSPPVAAYDPNSGANVVLVTHTLQATAALPGPYQDTQATAAITSAATSPGGANLLAGAPAAAGTDVVSAGVTPVVMPETNPGAVAAGQLIAFDVTIPVPSGTLRDLRLDTVLPGGQDSLSLVSATVTGKGSQLSGPAPTVSGGSISFGTVTSGGETSPGNASETVRLVVQAQGTASGPATLDVVASGQQPSGGRWTAGVASTVGVVVPPNGSPVTGIAPTQDATATSTILPFANLQIADAIPNDTATLAITLLDGSLGSLEAGAGGTVSNGTTFLLSGSVPTLQTAAQGLMFTAAAAGTARFNVTVVNGAGGVVQNRDTAVAIAPSVDTAGAATHYAPAPGSTFTLTDAAGNATVSEGEAYAGPVSYVQSQYIHDGAAPMTIVAGQSNVFIQNFSANDTVILAGGRNVVNAGTGSNVLVGGSGTDSFFVDARGGPGAWDTLENFHSGDLLSVFGFKAGVSRYSWTNAGTVPGQSGATLQLDLAGTGHVDASLTFAGMSTAAASQLVLTTGQGGSTPYLSVLAR